MLVSEFEYELPPELIAQTPSGTRDASRLMLVDRAGGGVAHRSFGQVTDYLRPGDVLVVNDTKVFPARLKGVKDVTGGGVEALLLKDMGGGRYNALMKGKLPPGTRVLFPGGLGAAVEEDRGGGIKVIRFDNTEGLDEDIDRLGHMPLPPYISREGGEAPTDRERYQTVYARKRGAVAAPTAGLHFTEELMGRIRASGVTVASVTLHVGIGTFLPVREDVVERHIMHEEEYEVPEETADAVNRARASGGRVIVVGTTSARTLESAADGDGTIRPGASATSIYIYPGYTFRAVDGLITNFHLPRSTLLMLVCAFAGMEKVLSAYREAVREGYRFYSYGDAMIII